MKKIKLFILLLFVPIYINAQDSPETVIDDLFGVKQLFPFGYNSSNADFISYNNDIKKASKINGNDFISSVKYLSNGSTKVSTVIVELKYGKKNKLIANILPKLSGHEEYLQTGSWSSSKEDLYCYKDYVLAFQRNQIKITCYDFANTDRSYDEFEKMHSVFMKPDFEFFMVGHGASIFYFSYFKIKDIKSISLIFETSNFDWMFARDAKILLDNGDVIDIKLVRKTDVSRSLNASFPCNEFCVGDIPIDKVETILSQKNAKVRISGDNFNESFLFNPASKSSLRIAYNELLKK